MPNLSHCLAPRISQWIANGLRGLITRITGTSIAAGFVGDPRAGLSSRGGSAQRCGMRGAAGSRWQRPWLLLGLSLMTGALHAQPQIDREAQAAPPQPGVIALRPAAGGVDGDVWHLSNGQLSVRNVTQPTLLPVLPTGPRSGSAVIVAPGGGFLGLAMETEGYAVARWLASQGIVAFVLKYRLIPTPMPQAEFADLIAAVVRGEPGKIRPPADTPDEAYADGLAALKLVRSRAAEFGIDPSRVGFMGFSAGGFLTRTLVERGGDQRPDFGILVYPNMKAIQVPPARAPALFVLIAQDDFLLRGLSGFPLVESYRAAGAPVDFHLLSGGGHGFGLGRQGTPSEGWPMLLQRWLKLQRLSSP